LCDL
jgi:hypothetical protein